jgi:hypothetical protein
MELFQTTNFNFKVHTPTLFFEKCVIRIFQNRHRRADILTIQSRMKISQRKNSKDKARLQKVASDAIKEAFYKEFLNLKQENGTERMGHKVIQGLSLLRNLVVKLYNIH